jgi:hypothetical protein
MKETDLILETLGSMRSDARYGSAHLNVIHAEDFSKIRPVLDRILATIPMTGALTDEQWDTIFVVLANSIRWNWETTTTVLHMKAELARCAAPAPPKQQTKQDAVEKPGPDISERLARLEHQVAVILDASQAAEEAENGSSCV